MRQALVSVRMQNQQLPWVYAEIVSRPYRWADDGWKHANNRSISERCLYADQDSYADVLPDMASGYMLFPKAWFCLPEVHTLWPHACHLL